MDWALGAALRDAAPQRDILSFLGRIRSAAAHGRRRRKPVRGQLLSGVSAQRRMQAAGRARPSAGRNTLDDRLQLLRTVAYASISGRRGDSRLVEGREATR